MIKKQGLRPTSLLITTYWSVWSSLQQRKYLHYSLIDMKIKEYCHGNYKYLIHPGQTRTETIIRNNMTWPGITQGFEHWLTKKERQKYGLLPPKIAESDTVSLGHGLCGSGGTTPFTIRTTAKTHSLTYHRVWIKKKYLIKLILRLYNLLHEQYSL
jgi:hypothetical protein